MLGPNPFTASEYLSFQKFVVDFSPPFLLTVRQNLMYSIISLVQSVNMESRILQLKLGTSLQSVCNLV